MSAPVVAVLAIVLRQGAALLVQRKNPPDAGLWGFPGGRLDFGEALGDGACRELREETGIVARAGALVDVIEVLRPADSVAGVGPFHYLLMGMLCDGPGGDPVAADDALDARFVPFQKVFDGALPLCPDVARLLQKAITLSGSDQG